MKDKKIKHIELSSIINPNITKELNYKELEILAKDIREYIIDSVAKNGGHLGSNLGTVDAIISLCKIFDFDKDKIIFDVGHQSYAYKILTGRSLDNLRQKDGISGFQKVSESAYDVFEAGHSSTSISVANGMAIARDLNKENYDVIAFIGDASIVNGLAFEGLNNSSQGKHKIIIVLNDNNMSISRPIGGMGRFFKRISNNAAYNNAKQLYRKVLLKTRLGSKIYYLTSRYKNQLKHFLIPTTVFDNMGYKYIGPINGHDMKAMDKAFAKAKKQKKSCVIHLRTIKGKGYKPAENDENGSWHGVSPFDKNTGHSLIEDKNNISWSKKYADLLYENMGKDEKSILITPAMIYGSCLEKIFQDYKKRCFDVGIAEEHAFTMAGGLAIEGFHPIISIYSTFLQRGYDEMVHDIVRMNLNSTLLIDRCGMPGPDGETHQGIFDESLLYGIPNTVIAMAANDKQAEYLINESFKFDKGLFAIRLPKENIMLTEESNKIGFGEWDIVNKCKKAHTCVVGVGPNIIRLCKLIKENDLNVDVINAIYQKPFNEKYIDELIKYKKVIIYQSYATKHGFVHTLIEKMLEKGFCNKIIIKAVPDTFINHAKSCEQLEQLGLLPEQLLKDL